MASSVWSVGDTKSFSVSSQNLTARIIGFNFDNKTSGGKAGISFDTTTLLAQKMNLRDEDDNYGGFLEMYLGNYLNSSFVNLLPTDMQQALASVNKGTASGYGYDVNESMKVFIFSRDEILGHPTTGAERYPLYTSGNSYRKKMPNESSYEDYWLRTRYSGSDSIYYSVGSNGYIEDDHKATELLGVAIGFCV